MIEIMKNGEINQKKLTKEELKAIVDIKLDIAERELKDGET